MRPPGGVPRKDPHAALIGNYRMHLSVKPTYLSAKHTHTHCKHAHAHPQRMHKSETCTLVFITHYDPHPATADVTATVKQTLFIPRETWLESACKPHWKPWKRKVFFFFTCLGLPNTKLTASVKKKKGQRLFVVAQNGLMWLKGSGENGGYVCSRLWLVYWLLLCVLWIL